MKDPLGRYINYLRVSITDRCNLRCVYCMGAHGIEQLRHEDVLSFEELAFVATCAARVGISKFRLTGGEPLVRLGVKDLVGMLSRVPGARELTMTTNGVLLAEHADALRRNGLKSVNISLDTLRRDRFRAITRLDALDRVLAGIEAALAAGFDKVKVNVVVMRGVNDDEVADFARLTLDRPLDVRFIELMAIGHRRLAEAQQLVPCSDMLTRVRALGELIPQVTSRTSGPALVYQVKGARGRIGFICAVTEPFCSRCNRLRLTADGRLRSCLLAGGEIDLRTILRSGATEEDVIDAMRGAAAMKPAQHAGRGEGMMRRIGG